MSNSRPVLEVEKLGKTYVRGKERIVAVKELSFEGFSGEILGILGPNGSGKTTTIKSIATIVDHDTGVIRVLGKDNRRAQQEVLSNLGAVLEGARNIYWTLTPEENCFYFAGLHGLSRNKIRSHMDEMFTELDLVRFRKQEVGTLSKGNQQKVAVCCSLISKPSLVLLDEPTLGLDVETTFRMKKWLRHYVAKNNIFLLITSHDMHFIEAVCDRVIIVQNGSMVTNGTVQELKESFSQRSVELRLKKTLTDLQLSLLNTKNISFRCEVEGDDIILKALIPEPDLFYDIFDILRLEKQPLLSLSFHESNLEEIFLSLIKAKEKKEC